MNTKQQIAAQAARDIFTRYMELRGMFREEDVLPIIKSAIEEGIQAWLCANPDSVLSRAAHASEQDPNAAKNPNL